jgi:hypothetical protein
MKNPKKELWGPTFAILTGEPNAKFAEVHQRMTTFLEPRDYEEYWAPAGTCSRASLADSSCREDEDAIDREQPHRQYPGKPLRYYVNRNSLTDQAEDVVMREEFGQDQNNGDNS